MDKIILEVLPKETSQVRYAASILKKKLKLLNIALGHHDMTRVDKKGSSEKSVGNTKTFLTTDYTDCTDCYEYVHQFH